jgi:acetyl esterase
MPLDPHAKRLLGLLAAGAGFDRLARTARTQREAMLHLSRAVDARNVAIGRVDNFEIERDGAPIPIRVYTPVGAELGELPGIVYFHGGMGVFCNLETHDGLCRLLANASECRVISVDYRLAPEHPFPAALDDAWLALTWAFDHAKQLGIDARRIAVAGDSAGGTLAAATCLLARERGGPAIALQVLLCAVTDLFAESASWRELGTGHFIDRETFAWARDQYVSGADPNDERISPLRARDHSRLPPAHVHTAEFDPVRDEGKAYADALRAAGGDVRYVCHAGMIHHFYCMSGLIPHAREIIGDVGSAVREALAAR